MREQEGIREIAERKITGSRKERSGVEEHGIDAGPLLADHHREGNRQRQL